MTWKGLRAPSVQCISKEGVVKLTIPVGNERRALLQTCLAMHQHCVDAPRDSHLAIVKPKFGLVA